VSIVLGGMNDQHEFYLVPVGGDNQISGLNDLLHQHIKDAPSLIHVKAGELVVAATGSTAVRARVVSVEIGEDGKEKASIFCLDHGSLLVAPLHFLHHMTEAIARFPFKAIPCGLYGVKNLRCDLHEQLNSLVSQTWDGRELSAKLIAFSGNLCMVQLFLSDVDMDGNVTVNDFAEDLAARGLCLYHKPSEKRCVYDREQMISLKHVEVIPFPNLSELLAEIAVR